MIDVLNDFCIPGKANVILGGQWGSESKGLIAGAVGMASPPDIVTTNNAVQSGHTFVCEDGSKFVGFHIPTSAILAEHSLIHLNAGAIIELEKLAEELEEFGCAGRTVIHPRAAIIEQADRDYEHDVSSGAAGLASTQKGVGRAFARKIMREGKVAADYIKEIEALGATVGVVDCMAAMDDNKKVIVEVPQGFSLSINAGYEYPKCTSRDCTVAQALSDANIHPSYIGNTMVIIRTYPIRVGNLMVDGKEVGNSGGCYSDQQQLPWKHFAPLGVEPELTTVTKRVRKIFTFSDEQFGKMMKTNRPTHLALTFVNYLSGKEEFEQLVSRISGGGQKILWSMSPKVSGIYQQGEEQAMFEKLGWVKTEAPDANAPQ